MKPDVTQKLERLKRYTKIAVSSQLIPAAFSVIMSNIVYTAILCYYVYGALDRNINILKDPDTLNMTLLVSLVALAVNLPLSFCSKRFFYLIAKKNVNERLKLKEYFAPFGSPKLLISGCTTVFLTGILSYAGILTSIIPIPILSLAITLILWVPITLSYSVSVSILSESENCNPVKAMKDSRRFMKGKKLLLLRALIPTCIVYFFLNIMSGAIFFLALIVPVAKAMIDTMPAALWVENEKIEQDVTVIGLEENKEEE